MVPEKEMVPEREAVPGKEAVPETETALGKAVAAAQADRAGAMEPVAIFPMIMSVFPTPMETMRI
jgi:hypothetical protein